MSVFRRHGGLCCTGAALLTPKQHRLAQSTASSLAQVASGISNTAAAAGGGGGVAVGGGGGGTTGHEQNRVNAMTGDGTLVYLPYDLQVGFIISISSIRLNNSFICIWR